METASLPVKQPAHLATVLSTDSNKITEKLMNGSEVKSNAPVLAVLTGKAKGKKKIEDIITNLKKVKQVANISTDVASGSEPQEDDASFASMCTIRKDTPDYSDVTELPPLKKQSPEQFNVVKQDKKTSPLPVKIVQPAKIIQTTSPISNPPNPVRQVILQTVPQKSLPNQQTPIILNKLPPGFIIRNDLPSGSFANLQNTSASAQPKLLLITKTGGPFFLAQNLNASTIHPQAKPVNKANVSPVQTTLSAPQKGRPPTLNTSILGSPTKTNTETPLITVQYNLPYPNNNCKVVNKPINAQKVQNSPTVRLQTLGNVIQPSGPREMMVNFAGNQTAHITTMSDETSVIPEKKTRFIPSFVYCSPSAASSIKNKSTTLVREKQKEKTFGVATSSATASNASARINGSDTGLTQMPQRRFTYDEKIAKLTGKVTDIYQSEVNGKAKTSSIGLKRKSIVEPNVRVSNRKRQQTERAKLFEKSKKRKKTDDRVPIPGRQKTEKMKLNVKVKVEKEDDSYMSSPKAVSPGQTINKSLSKKTVPPQTSVEIKTNSKKKEEDDPDSLYRDPALLTREERALQRALMMFKELEEKQARKKPKNEADETSACKNGGENQLDKTDDVQRKRKISIAAGNSESLMKKRKRGMEKQSIENKSDEKSGKGGERGQKNSEIVGKMMKEKMHLPIEKSPIHLKNDGKREDSPKVLPKKAETTSETVKDSSTNQTKENKQKTVKDVTTTPKLLKASPKTPESTGEKHRVKTYMLVPSYHGFKDFSPIVLGSRTRSKKTEPVNSEKEEEVPVTKTPEKSEKDIALLVIETVGKKAVKQDVVAKNEQMRDFVKNSLRAQGMLKQDLELTEKDEDADLFENREMRHLTVNRNTGETVLHKASRMGYDETVYHCIQQGSDSNAKDNAGWTPLHEACSRGHADVVRVLAKYNANVNACSNDGIRPIHDAADNGNIDSLRLLMAYGADPFISTYSGRSVVDCAKRTEAKAYIKACIGDLYLNDERNNSASVDYENRWEFRGSSSIIDKDRKYLGDVFDNVPKQQSNKSAEFEWSETPHLPTFSLPLVEDGIIVGRKNYILLNGLQEALNKPRQNVVRLLKRTKIREMSWTEFTKEASSSYFNQRSECLAGSSTEEGMVELVPLNWTVRSLLKIKCEHLAL